MEKVYRGTANYAVETTDITALSNIVCGELECGDKVVVDNDGEKTAYVVAYKEDASFLKLVSLETDNLEIVKYEKEEGLWVYSKTEQPSGGTQLYKHTLKFGSSTPLIVISNSNKPITSNQAIMSSKPLQILYEDKVVIGSEQSGATEFSYYGLSNGSFGNVVMFDWATPPTDTITAL